MNKRRHKMKLKVKEKWVQWKWNNDLMRGISEQQKGPKFDNTIKQHKLQDCIVEVIKPPSPRFHCEFMSVIIEDLFEAWLSCELVRNFLRSPFFLYFYFDKGTDLCLLLFPLNRLLLCYSCFPSLTPPLLLFLLLLF